LAEIGRSFCGEDGGEAGPTVGGVGAAVREPKEGVGKAVEGEPVGWVMARTEEVGGAVSQEGGGERWGCVRQAVTALAPEPDDGMGMMAIDAEGAEFTVELEVVDRTGEEGESGLGGDPVGEDDVDISRVVFRSC
jgi:hypothetical protein